jgi:Na+/proline symporter
MSEDMEHGDKTNQEIEELLNLLDISQEAVSTKPKAAIASITSTGQPMFITNSAVMDNNSFTGLTGYAIRQQAIQEVAKADPNNIQEVAASQLSIINSYYQSGLQQSQQSFKWSLIWGGIGLGFLIAAIGFLLWRQPTEVAIASGIGGAIVEVFAGTYLYLYKHASDQLAAFRASLESTQRLLLANSMCEKLEGEVEQTTRAELIRLMVNSAVQLQGVSTGKKEEK